MLSQAQYEAVFDGGGVVRGEVSPWYMLSLPTIAGLYPHLKLIMTVRNPVERMMSHLRMRSLHGRGNRHYVPPHTIAPDEAMRAALAYLLRLGDYKTVVEAADVLGMPIHVIDFCRLNEPQTWVALCGFLGVEPFDAGPIHENPSPQNILVSDPIRAMASEFYRDSNAYILDRFGIDLS